VVGLWFSPGTPVSSTNKTDRKDISEILLSTPTVKIFPLDLFNRLWKDIAFIVDKQRVIATRSFSLYNVNLH
jgi:hypothetical protein